MPRTMTPLATPFCVAITCPSTMGATRMTPVTARTRAAMASKLVRGPMELCTVTCPFKPRMRERSSWRNPFITAITIISVATPSAMPTSEKPEITETKLSCLRARK